MTEAEIIALKYNMNPLPDRRVIEFGNLTGTYKTQIHLNSRDKTNILIQYNPELNSNLPFLATGVLTPDSSGEYVSLSGHAQFGSYWNESKNFYLWYRAAAHWTISDTIDDISGPYWDLNSDIVDGNYQPFNGAIGVLTLAVQYPANHNVEGTLAPDATCNYAQAGVHNGRPFFRRGDNAYSIWWDGFWWTLTDAPGLYNTEWRSIPFIVRPSQDFQALVAATGWATIAMGLH